MLCVTTTAGAAGLIQQNYTSYRSLINKPLPIAPLALRFLPEHDAHALAVAKRAGRGPIFSTNHNGVDLSRDLERPEVRGPLLVNVRPRLSCFALGEVLRAMASRFPLGRARVRWRVVFLPDAKSEGTRHARIITCSMSSHTA